MTYEYIENTRHFNISFVKKTDIIITINQEFDYNITMCIVIGHYVHIIVFKVCLLVCCRNKIRVETNIYRSCPFKVQSKTS